MATLHRRALSCALTLAFLATAASAKDWSVTGKGRLVFDDPGVGTRPIANARVHLMDSDVDWDDTIAEGWTDANGNFNLSGTAGDPKVLFICDDTCSKPDPYVSIDLANDRVEVEHELGYTWRVHTGSHDNTAGTVDFGSFKFSSTDGQHAEILYSRLLQQYDGYTHLVGGRIPRHDGKVNILFPALLAAGVPWTTEESIHWPGSESRWNAVFHEFGHRIRHAADGDFAHFLYDVARFTYLQQHWDDKVTNAGYAFNEGWAEYHSTLLDPNERTHYAGWNVAAHGNNDAIEGNVAHKLMALSDKCGGFKNLWAMLGSAGSSVHSYAEFESHLKAKFPGCFLPKIVVTRPPIALLRRAPITLEAQHAVMARIASSVVATPAPSKLLLRQKVPANLQPQHAVITRLGNLRAQSHAVALKAALDALKRHSAALKPITLELAKSGEYKVQRQAARASFLKDALTPQLAEVNKLLGEIHKERAVAANAQLHPHLDFLKARYEKRRTQLQQALAMKPTPDMRIPLHLLPRGFGVAAAPAK